VVDSLRDAPRRFRGIDAKSSHQPHPHQRPCAPAVLSGPAVPPPRLPSGHTNPIPTSVPAPPAPLRFSLDRRLSVAWLYQPHPHQCPRAPSAPVVLSGPAVLLSPAAVTSLYQPHPHQCPRAPSAPAVPSGPAVLLNPAPVTSLYQPHPHQCPRAPSAPRGSLWTAALSDPATSYQSHPLPRSGAPCAPAVLSQPTGTR
jgi:hypothetical protein